MFQLSAAEFENLKSQFVTSSWGGMRRARPYAFTEQGVAMLSSVLNSKRAIEVNILIMRAFVKLRQMAASHKELARKLAELEVRFEDHDEKIEAIFEVIRQLMAPTDRPRRRIGFEVKEPKASYNKQAG
jgi:DNA-binding PadR family transcriptional regulator